MLGVRERPPKAKVEAVEGGDAEDIGWGLYSHRPDGEEDKDELLDALGSEHAEPAREHSSAAGARVAAGVREADAPVAAARTRETMSAMSRQKIWGLSLSGRRSESLKMSSVEAQMRRQHGDSTAVRAPSTVIVRVEVGVVGDERRGGPDVAAAPTWGQHNGAGAVRHHLRRHRRGGRCRRG